MKGQRARKGGYHKVGFEGGQMPHAASHAEGRLQVRDQGDARPKCGWTSWPRSQAEVIDLDALKTAQIVSGVRRAREGGAVGRNHEGGHLKGIGATKGARAAIEAAGGKIEAPEAGSESG